MKRRHIDSEKERETNR